MKQKLLLVFFTTILSLNAVFAVDKTFNVTTTGDWNVAGNWLPSGVPAASDNVTIPNGKSATILTSVSRTGTTNIESGGTLSISAGGTLTNTGAISLSGILDLSLSSGTATLNNNSGGSITVTGTVDYFDGYLLVQANGSGSTVFNNNSGATITLNSNSYLQISANNSATNAGTINNNSSLIWVQGTLNNTGTINSSSGLITGYGGVVSGSLYTNPTGSTINADQSILVEYSCLSFSNGLTNNGILHFNVDGTSDCNDKDKITVTGTMTFGGTFTAKGSPANGTVTLMTYGSRNGTTKFTNTYALLSNGKYLNILPSDYGATTLTGTVANTVLGVDFLNFDANTVGGKNYLTWSTASETNNKGFDIERSRDGETFQNIGYVKGNNKPSSYQYIDNQPFKMSYYRLKQVDFDGTETLSKVVSVELKVKTKGLKVYPTLVSNGILTIDTEGGQLRDFSVTNLLGQQILAGKTTQQIDVSRLSQGTYVLKVDAEQVKFVKQ